MNNVAMSNQVFKIGWSVDIDHSPMPRFVFRKIGNGSDSACFMYSEQEVKAHLHSSCMTNLEYLEGCEFSSHNKLPEARETAMKLISQKHQYNNHFPF